MKNTALEQRWRQSVEQNPLIAILRGISAAEAVSVATVLIDAGFTIIEVPLNSPAPLDTIRLLSEEFGTDIIIGAGTVLTDRQANEVAEIGGTLIVAPAFSPAVAAAAASNGSVYCAGVATPTEAFNALDAGAAALKLFPAELVTPSVVKAMRAVLPADVLLLPVGGITPDNMSSYLSAGANGFGIGSALYQPGVTLDSLKSRAEAFVSSCTVER